jgi:alanine racemase
MEKQKSKTWVEVDSGAIKENLRVFKRHLGSSVGLMCVVKSNAYGHGLTQVAKIAQTSDVSFFGVDNVDEGVALRQAGIKKPILILGYTLNSRLKDCIKFKLSFVVYNRETARALKALAFSGKALVHLEIETGITRQGLHGDELRALVRDLKKLPKVHIEGVFTHFANIEDTTESAYAELQLRRFQESLEMLKEEGIDPAWKHTACSAAAILFPETYFNLARVGVSTYGLWPSKETHAVAQRERKLVHLRPALSWKTVVAQIKSVTRGTPVSYGLTERVAHDSKVAVIPVGYWDGFDRGLSSVGFVLIRGQRCKVLGRVCMNMCMVDVTDVPDARVEDEVVLIGTQKGQSITAEEMAGKLGTINYEVVTRINPLLPRVVR